LTGISLGWTVVLTGSKSGKLREFTPTEKDYWLGPDLYRRINLGDLAEPGEFIIVEQSLSLNGKNFSSGASPAEAVQVLPLPSKLPAPIVKETPHTCSDAIGLEGLVPGARVHVAYEGGGKPYSELVHFQTQSVELFASSSSEVLPEGSWIDIWQVISEERTGEVLVPGSPVRVGPIPNLRLRNPLPKLEYCNKPQAGGREVCLKYAIPGANIIVESPTTEPYETQSLSETFHDQLDYRGSFRNSIGMGAEDKYGIVTASQALDRCGLRSEQTTIRIASPPRSYAQGIQLPICSDRDRVLMSKLVPGMPVRIVLGVGGVMADSRTTIAPRETWAFPLPADWKLTDASNRMVSIGISQKTSGGAYEVVETTLVPGSLPKQPKIVLGSGDAVWTCSAGVSVTGLLLGAEVTIIRTDGQTVVDWTPVTSTSMWLDFPVAIGPLPSGVKIYAHQRGCRTDIKSTLASVAPYREATLPRPEVSLFPPPDEEVVDDRWDILFPRSSYVQAEGLVVGARAYAVINGSRYDQSGLPWSQVIKVRNSTDLILLRGPVKGNLTVAVRQELCGGFEPVGI
jgi:hypothetical protein